MKHFRHHHGILFLACAVLFIAACGQQKESTDDVPVTTVSDEAREYYLQARYLHEVGRNDDAIPLLDKAIAADSTFALAYCDRGYLSDNAVLWTTYRDLAERYAAGSSEAEQLIISSMRKFEESDTEGMLEICRQLAEMYPRSARARLFLADAYDNLGQTGECRKAAEEAVKLDSEYPAAHSFLAYEYTFNEPIDLGKAEQYARSYADLAPEESEPFIRLGDVYRAQDKLLEAHEAYARAVELQPGHTTAHLKKGHANSFMGHYEEARADYRNALNTAEGLDRMYALNYSVITHVMDNDIEAALEANQDELQQLPELITDPGTLLRARSLCCIHRMNLAIWTGKFDIAREAFKNYASSYRRIAEQMDSPEFNTMAEANILRYESALHAHMGEYDRARELADRSAEYLKDLKDPRAMENVHLLWGFIALKQENYTKALEHFKRADPENIVVKFRTAQAEEGLGNTERAMKLYREIADYRFLDLSVALIRGKVLGRLGTVS